MAGPARMKAPHPAAFTLVEILIVVVILGILAAIVIPQFNRTVSDTAQSATFSDLQKIRRAVEVYRVRYDAWPPVAEIDGDPAASWGPLVGENPRGEFEFMLTAPINPWVGGANARRVVVVDDAVPDTTFQTDYGWIFDPVNGRVLAGSFDDRDRPIDRP